jgi:hypothetical protein
MNEKLIVLCTAEKRPGGREAPYQRRKNDNKGRKDKIDFAHSASPAANFCE